MLSLDAPNFYSRCPQPVEISGLGTGSQLSHAQTLQIADTETNIYLLTYSMEQSPSWEANWFSS
jgi:hypothetical protein